MCPRKAPLALTYHLLSIFLSMIPPPPTSTLFPYTTLFRSLADDDARDGMGTTVTALLLSGDRMAALNVGDSRCYLVRDGERSEEHTSELQSRPQLVCRLLLEKKNTA